MRFSPILDELGAYPFAVLDEAKARARASGVELIDFSIGDPREGAEPFIRDALIAALDTVAGIPASSRACPSFVDCDRRMGPTTIRPGARP